MVKIDELSEYEVAAILRGLRGACVAINAAEKELIKQLTLKLKNAPPTLDTIRRARHNSMTGNTPSSSCRLFPLTEKDPTL